MGKNHGDVIERRLSRAALGAGLTETAKLIRQAAPKGTSIKKAVGTRFKKNRRSGIHEAKAGLNVGRKHGAAPHAHFFTLGTVERFTKTGDARGRIQANQFVSRAVNMGHPSIAAAMIKRIRKRLPREIEMLRRNSGGSSNKGYWSSLVANVKYSQAPAMLPDNGYG